MTPQSQSNQPGGSNDAETATRQGSPSTNAENQSMSDTLDTAAQPNQNSQPTPNSLSLSPNAQDTPENVIDARMLMSFAQPFVRKGWARWAKIQLASGTAYALILPTANWELVGKEILPKER